VIFFGITYLRVVLRTAVSKRSEFNVGPRFSGRLARKMQVFRLRLRGVASRGGLS